MFLPETTIEIAKNCLMISLALAILNLIAGYFQKYDYPGTLLILFQVGYMFMISLTASYIWRIIF